MVEQLQEYVMRFRYLYYDDFSLYASTAEQHNKIVNAISGGKSAKAREEADAHVKALKKFVYELGKKMEQQPDAE